jgi:hypothetical protein
MEKKPKTGENALKIFQRLMPNRRNMALESNVKLIESDELLTELDQVQGVEGVDVKDPYQIVLAITEEAIPAEVAVEVEKLVRKYFEE